MYFDEYQISKVKYTYNYIDDNFIIKYSVGRSGVHLTYIVLYVVK